MPVEKNADGKYVLKSGDTTVTLTEDELYERASKGFGAEARFEEASRIRTEAESSLAVATQKIKTEYQGLLQAADAGDVTAYERVLDMIGVVGADKYERMRDFQSGGEVPAEAPPATGTGAAAVEPPQVPLPAELRGAQDLVTAMQAQGIQTEDMVRILKNADKGHKKDIRDRIYSDVAAALDKDPVLGTMVSAGGPKAERLVELAKQKVRGRIFDGEKSGPDLYARVLKEVKGIVEDFGPGEESTPPPGLGASPFATQMLSQAKEPPEAASVTGTNYASNVAERLAHMMAAPDPREAQARDL